MTEVVEEPTCDYEIPLMTKSQRVQRLREHLNVSNIKHKDEIMKLPTLKEAHVYCVLYNLSGQQYGPLLENFIRLKFNYIKNKSKFIIIF